MKVRAILNPRAGVAARAALGAVKSTSTPWGELDLKLTTAPGDARRLASEAAEAAFDVVLTVGGDGTANEAAWGLLGSQTALGIVPTGSGNAWPARCAPPALRRRAALAADGGCEWDVVMANGRPSSTGRRVVRRPVGEAFPDWGRAAAAAGS